jgi:hypothetical protein
MKNLLFALLLLPLATAAQTKEPIVYNDKIVGYQNDVVNEMLNLNASINQEGSTHASIEAQRLQLLKTAQRSISDTQKMQAFEGNSELRDAAVSLFKFYDGVIRTEYKQMIDIIYKEEITEDDLTELNALVVRITEEEITFDERFKKAQSAFARTHGLDLIENELQDEIDSE